MPFLTPIGFLNRRLLFVGIGVVFLVGFNQIAVMAERWGGVVPVADNVLSEQG